MTDLEKILQGVSLENGKIKWPSSQKRGRSGSPNLVSVSKYATIGRESTSNESYFSDYLYEKYINPNPNKYIPENNVRFFDIADYFQNFVEKRFWILNSKLPNDNKDVIIAFKDGINTIVRHGGYIRGGVLNNDLPDEEKQEIIYIRYATQVHSGTTNYYIYFRGEELLNNNHRAGIRIYFNLKPIKEKIIGLVAEINNYLDRRKIPFEFKIPVDSSNFGRSDTLVLYVAQCHYQVAFELTDYLKKQYADIFDCYLPLFVKEISSGIGYAEEPVPHDSYGKSRCNLIEDIIDSFVNKDKNVTMSNRDVINSVIEELKERGYSENDFFRNPNTNFDYNYKKTENALPAINSIWWSFPVRKKLKKYYDVAESIALELIERAIYDEDTGFSWISYEEKQDKKYYRFLNEAETFNILVFLFECLYFREFKDKVIDSVYYKIICKTLNNSRFDSLKKSILSNTYTGSMSEVQKINNITLVHSLVSDKAEPQLNDWQEIRKEIFNEALRKEMQPQKIVEAAEYIFNKYYKEGKPIPNGYGDNNYEYCPGKEGRLSVGKVMLYASKPELRKRNTQKHLKSFFGRNCH